MEREQGIAPLAQVDHAKLVHQAFIKNVYAEHPEVEQMETDRITEFRKLH